MNKKSILALTMAGALSLSLLAACGGGDTGGGATPPATTPPVVTDSPMPSETIPPETTPPADTTAPEDTAPPEATPGQTPAPSQKPAESQKPAATPKPSQKPAATPAPEKPAESQKPVTSAVQSTWNDIAKLDIPSLMDIDDATLTALYGISSSDLVEYVCKFPAVNVQATEFFIAQVKDGKMDTIKAAVEKRQADLEAQWASYLPEQLEMVQNYKLVVNGNYILFAICEDTASAASAFDSYTK